MFKKIDHSLPLFIEENILATKQKALEPCEIASKIYGFLV